MGLSLSFRALYGYIWFKAFGQDITVIAFDKSIASRCMFQYFIEIITEESPLAFYFE